MNLPVFSPTVPPHIPSIYFLPHPKFLQMKGEGIRELAICHGVPVSLSWLKTSGSLTNGHGADAGVLQAMSHMHLRCIG